MHKTTSQIIDLLQDEHKIDMSQENIDKNYRHAKRWQKIINYFRERYLKNISRIPIAHKHHRLTLLNEAAREALTWRTKSVNEYGTVEEKKIGILPAIISEARREVEGDKPSVKIENHEHYTLIVNQLHELAAQCEGEHEPINPRGSTQLVDEVAE